MSERVVIGDLWKKALFCSDFKRKKDISIKKYGLHIERVVNIYLVKKIFASILMFLKPEGSSVA